MHFNEHSAFYYQHFLGDKESFHLAWRKLNAPCILPERQADWHFDVLLQYDHEGQLLFQHRNGHKWQLGGKRDAVPGFLYEEDCFQFLEKLDVLLDVASSKVHRWTPASRSSREQEEAQSLIDTISRICLDY